MRCNRPLERPHGFTIAEFIVVVVTTGLLATVLVPTLTGARKVNRTASCAANLGQVAAAMQAYQGDSLGFLPCGVGTVFGNRTAAWSEAAWFMPKRELWFYKLCPAYLKQPTQLICPQDPHGGEFDFEAVDPNTGHAHSNTVVPSCGYGLNYALAHLTDGNLQAHPPLWGDRTILLADIGPDGPLELEALPFSNDSSLGQPWRDGGRMIWDDGNNRGWFTGPTWLTTRHGKGINMAALDGSVRPARTLEVLARPIAKRYNNCYRIDAGPPRTYVCHLCNLYTSDLYHYDFSDSSFWWWTGAMPTQAVASLVPSSQR